MVSFCSHFKAICDRMLENLPSTHKGHIIIISNSLILQHDIKQPGILVKDTLNYQKNC